MPASLDQTEKVAHSPDLLQEVCEHGWLHLKAAGSESSLATETLKLARRLGEPVAGRRGHIIEILTPHLVENAEANSLSVQHGLGPFPLHIDGTHCLQPPRFIVLACARPGLSPAPTLLARFQDLRLRDAERRRCESAVFLVRNGRRSFYSTILDRSRPFIRFDQGCMIPSCPDSREALKEIDVRAAEIGPTALHWRSGDILIIDNWRVLHGRGLALSVVSSDRCILRVNIR
jgi:hypothetical protein